MIYDLLRAGLFRLEAEHAHELVSAQMERLGEISLLRAALRAIYRVPDLSRKLWDLHFRNPLGIAAGFDKNATMVPFLRSLGFGFVEVGTVTLEPQAGNPRPRLFRIPDSEALINRMGFNNDGARLVVGRLEDLRRRSAAAEETPLLVNIGKNRDVPIAGATRSYAACYRLLARWADGVVVNVSSPNTPSLRDLQAPEQLKDLLIAMRNERESIVFDGPGVHPILVKIAPDLTEQQADEAADVCRGLADGMIATNTTISREGLVREVEQSGGLSGKPLFERSTAILRLLRKRVGPEYPLVGVGGIFSVEDAAEKIAAGADLVQAYTGFIYQGPAFASKLVRGLAGRMAGKGGPR
ncbi:MAG: quinone-dependent dihydroorotate dehydrogenase [Thermoanaerobaculia bacterium]